MHADVPADDRYVNRHGGTEKGPRRVTLAVVTFGGERMSERSGSQSPHQIFYFIFHT